MLKRLTSLTNRVWKGVVRDGRDMVSGSLQTDSSAGPCYYIHPTTGELVTVAAGEPLIHPTLGNVSLPAYTQLCQDSEDPGEWSTIDSTLDATGETFGSFIEYTVTDSGSTNGRAIFWKTISSGSPSGILYFSVRYRSGTSGYVRIRFLDITAGNVESSITGDVGGIKTIVNNAGVATILSDEYDSDLGYYITIGTILFTNLSNSLSIGIGPKSSDGSNILVLGADVSEDPAILDFHVPSSGSNVTIASRAGTTKLASLSTGFPKFYDVLDGVADGVELVTDGGMETAPISNWTAYNALSAVELSTINSGLKSLKVTDNGASSRVYQAIATDIGERYRINSYVYSESTNTGVFLARVAAVDSYNASVSEYLTENKEKADGAIADNTWQSFSNDFIATASTTYIILVTQSNSGDVSYFDNISVKQISPAAARHSFTWTPGVSYTDHTTIESIMTPSDADGFLKASAAGGFELSDGTNNLRWPPTVGDDIPRVWSVISGSPTINGDMIEFADENTTVRDSNYWTIGKSYRINATVSDYTGSGNIYLPYESSVSLALATVFRNSTHEYDINVRGNTYAQIFSFAGHTATVTVNSIYELADYQFKSGLENPAGYPMEIVYGYNEALDAYKMELSVYVDGEWVSVMGDFDQSFDPDTDFIYGLSNSYQSAVKDHVVEKLSQSHWRS